MNIWKYSCEQAKRFPEIFRFWIQSGAIFMVILLDSKCAKACESCRSCQELSNEYLVFSCKNRRRYSRDRASQSLPKISWRLEEKFKFKTNIGVRRLANPQELPRTIMQYKSCSSLWGNHRRGNCACMKLLDKFREGVFYAHSRAVPLIFQLLSDWIIHTLECCSYLVFGSPGLLLRAISSSTVSSSRIFRPEHAASVAERVK